MPTSKRVLEYGVRAPVFLRKSTGANGSKRFSTNTYRRLVSSLVLSEISERILKYPGNHGRTQSRNPVLQLPANIPFKFKAPGVGDRTLPLRGGEGTAD